MPAFDSLRYSLRAPLWRSDQRGSSATRLQLASTQLGRSNLVEDIDAVPAVLDHAGDATHVACNTVEACPDQRVILNCGRYTHRGYIAARPFIGQGGPRRAWYQTLATVHCGSAAHANQVQGQAASQVSSSLSQRHRQDVERPSGHWPRRHATGPLPFFNDDGSLHLTLPCGKLSQLDVDHS